MKKLSKKGFTLIELLAVIVILGLLMAIAIPSVTKYINQSKKKTLVTTINNYISAASVEVNNMEYKFTDPTVVYAIPVNCIALEKGGDDPFGDWVPNHTVDTNGEITQFGTNWAYVLVQYDSSNHNYIYGFTFKDSAGYGMYPKSLKNVDEKGAGITIEIGNELSTNVKSSSFEYYFSKSELNTITVINYANLKSKWEGFNLPGGSNGAITFLTAVQDGNGKTTCTIVE